MAHANDVADEAISNMRTVRSFAAESTEVNLYREEIQRSRRLNEYLGIGIGVFQGLSNLAFNAAILGVIYVGGSYMADSRMQPGDLMSFMVTAQTIQKLVCVSLMFVCKTFGVLTGRRTFVEDGQEFFLNLC